MRKSEKGRRRGMKKGGEERERGDREERNRGGD